MKLGIKFSQIMQKEYARPANSLGSHLTVNPERVLNLAIEALLAACGLGFAEFIK
jgi:hypothetical protein